MPTVFQTPLELKDSIGKHLGYSEWLTVEQSRIDQFADATLDHQWIHLDAERAKSGPFGATIAHGYLTSSLVSHFLPQIITVGGISMGINYGADRLRFPSPVRVGSKLRAGAELIEAEDAKDGSIQTKIRVTVEIEGSDKPACVIDSLTRYYPA
ncbi:MAG: MaoC family dehydratase [Myxococcota bacterium]|nr:MaoC family dehydratase [Myxococcota bacterium]